jgi:hypothetical protein
VTRPPYRRANLTQRYPGRLPAAQGVSDLAWPDAAEIAFGGILKVTKKVRSTRWLIKRT